MADLTLQETSPNALAASDYLTFSSLFSTTGNELYCEQMDGTRHYLIKEMDIFHCGNLDVLDGTWVIKFDSV